MVDRKADWMADEMVAMWVVDMVGVMVEKMVVMMVGERADM